MSAQAGILYFDGRPIEPTLPARLSAGLARFGPDGSGAYSVSGLLMVHRALHVTPDDRDERQPYVSAHGHVMTWDGRLDNRDDLRLQLWRDLRDDASDVALAMAAYERWGADGFVRLIGDWSLAVWNADSRAIVLASDFAGVRPLYYTCDAEAVRWSTSLSVLLPDRSPDVDTSFLAGYVTFAMPSTSTPYRQIKSVVPGHAETWTSRGAASRRGFYQLPSIALRHADTRVYAEQLRSLFAESVRARLRSVRPVWSELSGGLDSSLMACMAHRLIRDRAAVAPAVRTVSYTSRRFPEADESRFIEVVEAQLGEPGHHVTLEESFELVDAENNWTTPAHPDGTALAIFRTVASHGGRTLLSGAPGDLIMGNNLDASIGVLEDLRDGAPGRALGRLRGWSRSTQEPIWILASRIAGELAPRRLREQRALRDVLRGHARSGQRSLHDIVSDLFLLTPDGARAWEHNLRELLAPSLSFPRVTKRGLIRGLTMQIQQRTFETPSELAGVHHTYPYLHRPLVELVLGMPSNELCRAGQPRFLMKEAFRSLLPDRIAGRQSKGWAAPIHVQMVKRQAPALLDRLNSLQVVTNGVIDRARLQTKLRVLQQGATRDVGNLLKIVRLERWLESLHARPCERTQIPA